MRASGMWEILNRVFGGGFMPHGHCYLWTPSMVWTQVSANLLIGVSYACIAATLAVLVRRIERMPFAWAFVAFGTFILSCGLTHFSDIMTVWYPLYWADAGVRVVTALASAATAVLIVPLVPKAVSLAHSAHVAEERRTQLEAAHRELAKAHAQLAERAEFEFRELIDNLPELAWTAQPDGQVDFFNRRWFEYTGTTPDDVGRRSWEALHDPALFPGVIERWRRSLQSGEPFEMEFPLRGADGVFRWFLTRVRPLRGPDDRILRWFGSNTDIDELRKVSEALTASLERERTWRHEAEDATRAKDEFLAAVSHELRTPLNAILGWSRLLRTGQLGPERVARAVATIERNTRAQVQLVEDLLDISRIVTGNLKLEPRGVDLGRVVHEAIESLRPAIEAKEVAVHVEVAPGAHDLVGDATRLQQVFWNVIGNAVKFSDRGGAVSVTLARTGSEAKVTVSDSGKGIAPDVLPYVFDRFRQGDSSPTRAHGGLGLGLAIAKHIVELHGGSIRCSSEGEGRGATFVVSLPQDRAFAETAPESQTQLLAPRQPLERPRELEGTHILVVDDDADSRDMARELLERSGAIVRSAESSPAALDAIEREPPEIILADIGMPGEDGYTFLAKVRGLPAMKGVPAAALTALARPEDRRRTLAAGFALHLSKPIEPGELVAACANLVRIRRGLR